MSYKRISPAPVVEGGTGAQTLTGVLIGNGTSAVGASTVTQYGTVVAGASNTVASVAPSSTSGVPLISQGSSANPAYGTAVVAGGGTGVTSNTAYAVLTGGTTSTNPIQSIASVGTSGQCLVSGGAGALPTFQDKSVITTVYTTGSGNHTLNNNTKFVDVYVIGGGGGGGSGRQGTTGASSGGGGGSSGALTYMNAPVSFFGGAGSTIAYSVGAGGTGGLAQASTSTNGNPGNPGIISSFGNLVPVTASNGGAGGTTTTASGGNACTIRSMASPISGTSGSSSGGTGRSTADGSASTSNIGWGGTSGGGGGGGDNVTERAGGAGGAFLQYDNSTVIQAGASGGTRSGTIGGSNGTAYTSITTLGVFGGGTGGGGGGGGTNAIAGGKGGNGASFGAGGGGGGGSVDGASSGAGGDGANGAIFVIEYL